MGFLEVVGVASILPFMQLVAKPEAITENAWLAWAYDFFEFESHRSMLLSTGLLVILLIAFANLFSVLTMWLQYTYSWRVAHNLGIRLLNTYLEKPYTFFLNSNSSDLRSYLISEVGSLTGGVLVPFFELVSKILVATVIFALLIVVNPKIAFMMFLLLGGAYLTIFLSRQNFLKRLGNKRIEANLERYRNLEELLTGIKTIRVYGVERYFYDRYEKASIKFCEVQPSFQIVMASPKYILEVIAFGGILGVTLFLFNTGGDIQSALPILSLYAMAGYRLLPALQRIFASAAKLRHNYPVLDRLYDDLLQGLDSTKPTVRRKTEKPLQDNIILQEITFQYENMPEPVVENLSLTISKGEVMALIGSTGSGKTTIIDLIVGLLTPTSGNLLLDGVKLTKENMEQWQNQIAYVPQDVFFFDATIKNNIVMGQIESEIDQELLNKVTKIADIHDFIIDELPDGFETEIGERGVRLSGGQRQRIGLARALYQNPTVLVLDEATSALDNITEQGIIESLKKLPEDITVIIIAHRLASVRHTDCIYVLEGGQIIDRGSYDYLLENSDLFRNMAQLS